MPRNELYTFCFFAVVKQQAVALIAITASLAYEGVNFHTLPRRDFEYHSIKTAECDLDGSITAFCIYNNGEKEIFMDERNRQN